MECSTGYHHPPHSQAPVHTTSVIKLCFPSLYNTAVVCVALGCAPLSLRHACVLGVHKMPAKQIMTKISECPELSPSLKKRKHGWSCPQDDTVELQGFTSCFKQLHSGQTPDTKGLLGTLWDHCEDPPLAEEELHLKCPQLLPLVLAGWKHSWVTAADGTGNIRDKASWWEVASPRIAEWFLVLVLWGSDGKTQYWAGM